MYGIVLSFADTADPNLNNRQYVQSGVRVLTIVYIILLHPPPSSPHLSITIINIQCFIKMLLHWLCELHKNRQQINMLILLGFTLYTITHARINTDAPTHQHTQAHTYTHFKRSKECFSLHLFILLFSFRFVTGILYYLLSVYNVTQQVYCDKCLYMYHLYCFRNIGPLYPQQERGRKVYFRFWFSLGRLNRARLCINA